MIRDLTLHRPGGIAHDTGHHTAHRPGDIAHSTRRHDDSIHPPLMVIVDIDKNDTRNHLLSGIEHRGQEGFVR